MHFNHCIFFFIQATAQKMTPQEMLRLKMQLALSKTRKFYCAVLFPEEVILKCALSFQIWLTKRQRRKKWRRWRKNVK